MALPVCYWKFYVKYLKENKKIKQGTKVFDFVAIYKNM